MGGERGDPPPPAPGALPPFPALANRELTAAVRSPVPPPADPPEAGAAAPHSPVPSRAERRFLMTGGSRAPRASPRRGVGGGQSPAALRPSPQPAAAARGGGAERGCGPGREGSGAERGCAPAAAAPPLL